MNMECLTYKNEINNTVDSVRNFSYEEKKSPIIDEHHIDNLLDAILDFKTSLANKTTKIYDVSDKMEKLTWYTNIDEESLKAINDLISAAKDLKSTLIRQYITFNPIKNRGIAKEEIRDFKQSIDELKESYEDLESVFFFLPQMPEFTETTKQLSLI